ncbi:hypothetical protein [Leifsonia sp. NCR5]|uniref:hypothetical protein n=1 Tax=Leifsonia sp. NCR5 TaxID=1978342 RepID=UPI002119E0B9|nr:hypothetical protein [Leifsonia sp. NCR5]
MTGTAAPVPEATARSMPLCPAAYGVGGAAYAFDSTAGCTGHAHAPCWAVVVVVVVAAVAEAEVVLATASTGLVEASAPINASTSANTTARLTAPVASTAPPRSLTTSIPQPCPPHSFAPAPAGIPWTTPQRRLLWRTAPNTPGPTPALAPTGLRSIVWVAGSPQPAAARSERQPAAAATSRAPYSHNRKKVLHV